MSCAATVPLLLLALSCAEPVVPVLAPVQTDQVKRGAHNIALVVLPNNGVASIHLHFDCVAGRIALSRIGVVNHRPDLVEMYAVKTKVYVDDGDPVEFLDVRDFDSRENNADFHILRDLPASARGTWLILKHRFVTKSTIRGPTIVLRYSVYGREGALKVDYQPVWDIPG